MRRNMHDTRFELKISRFRGSCIVGTSWISFWHINLRLSIWGNKCPGQWLFVVSRVFRNFFVDDVILTTGWIVCLFGFLFNSLWYCFREFLLPTFFLGNEFKFASDVLTRIYCIFSWLVGRVLEVGVVGGCRRYSLSYVRYILVVNEEGIRSFLTVYEDKYKITNTVIIIVITLITSSNFNCN